ncbi:thermonuclease family protein [Candidatus Microgenomates bacterium]|nr:thermonuclease family protein [Candidatus Microgenomates bacterium]
MNKKTLLIYGGLAIASIILLPIAPLILGSFVALRLFKRASTRKVGFVLATLTIIFSFILTGVLVDKFPTSPKQTAQVGSVSTETTPTPASTVSSASSLTPDPNITIAKVINVVDGDTFKLDSGKVVRMIGIDTPETVHPSRPVQCYGEEASSKTEELIEGKEIKLEKDVSEVDKYGRLLRYVYAGDLFVNEYLVREGFAMSSSYPPDIKYQDKFVEAQKKAQEENKGLWNTSACPSPTPRPTATPKPTTTTYSTPKPTTSSDSSSNSYTCNCSKTCPNLSCAEAQYQLNVCGCSARDADRDGIACDSQCQ